MKIINNLLNFFRRRSPSLQEIIDSGIPRFMEKKEGNIFDSPFIALLKKLRRFWSENWRVLLPVIVFIIGILVSLFVHFDSNP